MQNLRYLKRRKPAQAETFDKAIVGIERQMKSMNKFKENLIKDLRQNIMGIEGSAARMYWQVVGEGIPTDYQFKKRSRPPAEE